MSGEGRRRLRQREKCPRRLSWLPKKWRRKKGSLYFQGGSSITEKDGQEIDVWLMQCKKKVFYLIGKVGKFFLKAVSQVENINYTNC